MNIKGKVKTLYNMIFKKNSYKTLFKNYKKRYEQSTFANENYINYCQYEAAITKMYHTIEKVLAYLNYRAGFGEKAVSELIDTMKKYSKTYDVEAFFYKTALCTLNEYIRKNKEYGYENKEIEEKIKSLEGTPNEVGGIITFDSDSVYGDFKDFVLSRHSIREFSDIPVDIEKLKDAINLAQYTPSACNRQGWKTRIIENKEVLKTILNNQNGNRGFGEKIDKLLVITCDLCYFNKSREVHQAFIDGGMYAMNILHSLHYHNVATIPLSASLNISQEEKVRNVVKMKDSEVLIMFIGVGNYPDVCQTTRSQRRCAEIEII